MNKIVRLAYVSFKWYLNYFCQFFRLTTKPVHILFCMVDHFEPGTNNASVDVEKKRMKLLLDKYPELADRHLDSFGNKPKRTWFFPPHYHRNGSLRDLVSLCEKGYGEIELHLHHGKSKPDTSENLKATIELCLKEYSQFGIFGKEHGKIRYGFIHGDWALDNSRNGKFCGVNNELQILKETGCYADFTFPSSNESNPFQINSIYHAKDDPDKPKSYNWGVKARRHGSGKGDLLMIQGPIYPFFKTKSPFSIRIFGDSITGKPPVTKSRIDKWIRTGIHVRGKNEWIIVKTHTHGASDDADAVLGNEMDSIFSYLESRYNDGRNYRLHYVTARELYNIVTAVCDGKDSDAPEDLKDYQIKKPTFNSSQAIYEASDVLRTHVSKTYSG